MGHWNRQLPSGYILAKRKKHYESGRPIISFVDSPFRPMLNILARMIFQLIPVACHSISPREMSTISFPFYVRLLNMEISSFTTKTSLASSPALTKRCLLEPGICSWAFFAHVWMSATTKCSLSIQDEATILETSSRDERFDVLMSQGKSSSRTSRSSWPLL